MFSVLKLILSFRKKENTLCVSYIFSKNLTFTDVLSSVNIYSLIVKCSVDSVVLDYNLI